MIDISFLHWVAGFLEGEGSFNHAGSPAIGASQVQREPLERLQLAFGGHIGIRLMKSHKHKTQNVWSISGRRAAEIMLTIYAIMSPRRQGQINKVLVKWRAQGLPAKEKTTCPKGHRLLKSYQGKGTFRRCDVCRSMEYKKYIRPKKTDLATLKLFDV